MLDKPKYEKPGYRRMAYFKVGGITYQHPVGDNIPEGGKDTGVDEFKSHPKMVEFHDHFKNTQNTVMGNIPARKPAAKEIANSADSSDSLSVRGGKSTKVDAKVNKPHKHKLLLRRSRDTGDRLLFHIKCETCGEEHSDFVDTSDILGKFPMGTEIITSRVRDCVFKFFKKEDDPWLKTQKIVDLLFPQNPTKNPAHRWPPPATKSLYLSEDEKKE